MAANILPPAEKLPLAVRKNVRDDWDSKKADFEKELSDLLGTAWTVDINPLAIYPYAEPNSYGSTSLGSCIANYVSSAISSLKYHLEEMPEFDKDEINSIAHAHVLTLDIATTQKIYYSGIDVAPDGKLRLLFNKGNLGSNISDAASKSNVVAALSAAAVPPGSTAPYTFAIRRGLHSDYNSQIEAIRADAAEVLKIPDLKLTVDVAELAAKLRASKDSRDDWQDRLGYLVRLYFEGFVGKIKYQGFADDELLQEGFAEAIDKKEVVFRVVDKLETDTYNECVVKDGILYLQSVPKYFGSNVDDAAQKLVDRL